MLPKFILLLCAIAISSSGILHADATSANNPKMKEFYSTFPGSDANKDKVLTVPEMRSFLIQKLKSDATSENSLHLKKVLKKEPTTDLNKDGKLTKTELIKYLR